MTSFHGLMGCPNLCSHQDLQLCKPESRSHPKPTGWCLCSALPSFAWMIVQRCCSMHHPKSLTWCSRASPCTGHSQILSGLNQRNVFTCWLFSASFHKALAFRTSAVSKTQSSLKHLKMSAGSSSYTTKSSRFYFPALLPPHALAAFWGAAQPTFPTACPPPAPAPKQSSTEIQSNY